MIANILAVFCNLLTVLVIIKAARELDKARKHQNELNIQILCRLNELERNEKKL